MANRAPTLAYVGTYTRSGNSRGIEVLAHNPDSGELAHLQTVAEADPSFLAFHPTRRFLFAVSEGETRADGAVTSFQIDPSTGQLTALSRQRTEGGEPCHLTVDPSGRWVLVANHLDGSVAVLPIDADGRLGPLSDRRQHHGSGPGPTQAGPHAHFVTFDPSARRVLVCDKGIDRVMFYTLDTDSGTLVPHDPPFAQLHAGAAPRHLSFHPNGRYAYVNGEADMTITAFSYDVASGAMKELQVLSTLPESATANGYSTAHVLVEPSGRFVYVSNRGHDSIASFAIDAGSGKLTALGHVSTEGRTPRNFAIDPSGKRLYAGNQDSDTIVHFDIDLETGQLTPTGQVTSVGAPVCILFN